MLTASTGRIAGTPTTPNTYNVTATVSDGTLSATQSFTWTIQTANAAPTLTNPGNQTATVGQATVLQLVGSDPNGNPLTYTATGLPAGLALTASTGRIAGTPTTAGGPYNVTATVSDGTLSASQSFTWTIQAGNAAPTLTAPGNQAATVGQVATLQLVGNDANGDTLTYAASGLPPGLQVTASTGLIAGTPTTAGSYNVTATVSDGTSSAQQSFFWTIQLPNVAPSLVNPGNQTSSVGQSVVLQLQGSDSHGDPLTYSSTGLPPGLQLTASTGRIAGAATTQGTYNVTATVSDGSFSASQSFTWTVRAANVAPTLNAVGNQTTLVGQAVTLQLVGSDSNGDALTYAASGLPAGLQMTASTGSINGTPTTAGTYNVMATVSDGALSAQRAFTWTIQTVNVAPTLSAPGDQTSTAGQAVMLQLVGSDSNGDALTYAASGLPAGLQMTASTGTITGAPTTTGAYSVTATVSDGTFSAQQSFTWTIVPALTSTRRGKGNGTGGTAKPRGPKKNNETTTAYTGTTAVLREASATTDTTTTTVYSGTGVVRSVSFSPPVYTDTSAMTLQPQGAGITSMASSSTAARCDPTHRASSPMVGRLRRWSNHDGGPRVRTDRGHPDASGACDIRLGEHRHVLRRRA